MEICEDREDRNKVCVLEPHSHIPLSTQTGGRLPISWRGVHPEGLVEKAILWRSFYVGTGLVPVLTLIRTATRAVPTTISSHWLQRVRYFFNSS